MKLPIVKLCRGKLKTGKANYVKVSKSRKQIILSTHTQKRFISLSFKLNSDGSEQTPTIETRLEGIQNYFVVKYFSLPCKKNREITDCQIVP